VSRLLPCVRVCESVGVVKIVGAGETWTETVGGPRIRRAAWRNFSPQVPAVWRGCLVQDTPHPTHKSIRLVLSVTTDQADLDDRDQGPGVVLELGDGWRKVQRRQLPLEWD
jgi:hypothetical protein